jgi:hypothetical protein
MRMDDLIARRLDLCNDLIDRMVEMDGLEYTIKYLKEFGFSKENLEEMYFDRKDIDLYWEDNNE